MSFHQQNIEAFVQVLNTQRSLFSPQDKVSLDKLASSLPEDEEKISEAIASWYEQRPKILDAQLDILNSLLTNELNASRSIAAAIARSEAKADKDYRQELLDAIGTLQTKK
jgi:hypothetical protein